MSSAEAGQLEGGCNYFLSSCVTGTLFLRGPPEEEDVFMTGIIVEEGGTYAKQVKLTYPFELDDGTISYFTFTGIYNSVELTANFVLTGAPPGDELTGSLSLEVQSDDRRLTKHFSYEWLSLPLHEDVDILGSLVLCA